MQVRKLPPTVRSIKPGRWLLAAAGPHMTALKMLPVTLTDDGLDVVLEYSEGANDAFVGKLAEALRALGFAFAAPMDWSPSVYMRHLRQTGVIRGPFKEITPTPYGTWEVNEV